MGEVMRITSRLGKLRILIFAGLIAMLSINQALAGNPIPPPKRPVKNLPPNKLEKLQTPKGGKSGIRFKKELPARSGKRLTITGRLAFENCSPDHPVNFELRGRGLRRDVTARVVRTGADISLTSSYTLTLNNLPFGRWQVSPRLSRSDCAGGSWSPGHRSVSYTTSVQTIPNQHFQYQLPESVTRISMRLVAGAVTAFLRGTELRLNNYGPRNGVSYHVADDSFIQLSEILGRERTRFGIPEYVAEKGARRYLYYVNDINLRRIQLEHEHSRYPAYFKVSFFLEDSGTEFKGHCWRKTYRMGHFVLEESWRSCRLGSDSAAPDVQWNGARIDVFLQPVGYRGSIAFGEVVAEARGSIRAQGVCDLGPIDICNAMTTYRSQIRRTIGAEVARVFNRDPMRRRVAEAFRTFLDSHGVEHVRRVHLEGGELVVTHVP